MRSRNAHHPPQLVIVRPAQRVPDQMGAGVIVNESPGTFHEFATLRFAFHGRGTCGCGDEFGEVGFGYRAFETGEVASN